ncbi:MAG TPA: hypothetical protein VFU15_02650 [Bacteroidia bacterium]|nr:hypothetical protein [Bacteroidia bacterium]
MTIVPKSGYFPAKLLFLAGRGLRVHAGQRLPGAFFKKVPEKAAAFHRGEREEAKQYRYDFLHRGSYRW